LFKNCVFCDDQDEERDADDGRASPPPNDEQVYKYQ